MFSITYSAIVTEKTRKLLDVRLIGHSLDDITLLLRPESSSFPYPCEDLITKALICTGKEPLKDSGRNIKMTSSCRWPICKS